MKLRAPNAIILTIKVLKRFEVLLLSIYDLSLFNLKAQFFFAIRNKTADHNIDRDKF